MIRHRRAAVPLALAAALALAGCTAGGDATGTATPTDTATEPAEPIMPAAEGATTYPLDLQTPFGHSVLEARPERIAVVGDGGELDAVLALGVEPVIGSSDIEAPWYEGTRADDLPGFIDATEEPIELDKLIASAPDLIVAPSLATLPDDYATLTKVAPVLVADGEGELLTDWRSTTTAVGAALDLPGAAEQAVADADAAIEAAAQANPQFAGRTVAVLINDGPDGGLKLVNTAGSPAEALLGELGFAPLPNGGADFGADEDGVFQASSLALADADAIVVGHRGGSDGDPATARQWLESNAVYQSLGAVQRGAVATFEPDPETEELGLSWALGVPTALSAPWAAEEVGALVGPIVAAQPPAA